MGTTGLGVVRVGCLTLCIETWSGGGPEEFGEFLIEVASRAGEPPMEFLCWLQDTDYAVSLCGGMWKVLWGEGDYDYLYFIDTDKERVIACEATPLTGKKNCIEIPLPDLMREGAGLLTQKLEEAEEEEEEV